MTRLRIMLFFLCLVAAGVVASQQVNGYKNLVGKYAVSSRNLVDPLPNEKKDRVAFFIEGEAAAEIYSSLPVKEIKYQCDDALLRKASGGLVCTKDPLRREYICTFGVILETGKLVDASLC